MQLNLERMDGYGEYRVDGYQVNYLFGLNDLCQKYVKNDFSILELGVNNGVSTEIFCIYAKEVTAVDLQKTEKFGKVLSLHKNLSFFQKKFTDFYSSNTKKFDLIYIDGSHEYEEVKLDIISCLKFLNPGGMIAGHDYNSSCPGVIRAVDEKFNEIEVFRDSSWLKKIC